MTGRLLIWCRSIRCAASASSAEGRTATTFVVRPPRPCGEVRRCPGERDEGARAGRQRRGGAAGPPGHEPHHTAQVIHDGQRGHVAIQQQPTGIQNRRLWGHRDDSGRHELVHAHFGYLPYPDGPCDGGGLPRGIRSAASPGGEADTITVSPCKPARRPGPSFGVYSRQAVATRLLAVDTHHLTRHAGLERVRQGLPGKTGIRSVPSVEP